MAEIDVRKVDGVRKIEDKPKRSTSDITLKALKLAIANKLYISDPEVVEYISDHLARIVAFLQLAPREVSVNLVTTLLDMLPHDAAIDIVTRYIDRLRRMASRIMPSEGGYGRDPIMGIMMEMFKQYMASMTGQYKQDAEQSIKTPMQIPEELKRLILGNENQDKSG